VASKKKAAKAAGAVAAAKNSPYVQRVVEDEDLRDNVVAAFESARDAYDRLNKGKSPQKQILEDKKLQKSLQEAANSLRDAGEALRDGPKKKRKGGLGRKLLLLIVIATLALVLSEDLRNKVLDALFGKEEEFEYTSTTSPPTPAPTSPAGSTA
jgi:hypothetical protein